MPDFSSGLNCAWRTVASEAVHTQQEFIEPEYLCVGIAAALPRLGATRCRSKSGLEQLVFTAGGFI
jgi:hypothetical protein